MTRTPVMLKVTGTKATTVISLWFGNFFEPFYSNRDAVQRGTAEAAVFVGEHVEELVFRTTTPPATAR